MVQEASLEFSLRKIEETRNYLLDKKKTKIKHNDLLAEKYEKTYKYLNYIAYSSFKNYWLLFNFCICFIGLCCCWYYDFICPITTGIKKYKIIIKKKKKKHDKIVLLGKDKLNATIEVLIPEDLIDLYISHNDFVLVNNMLREYNEMKKETKDTETFVQYTI